MVRRVAVWGLATTGLVAFATPPFIWWLLSDHDRYVRVINGPPPFATFGSGPFQLWLALSFFSLALGAFVLAERSPSSAGTASGRAKPRSSDRSPEASRHSVCWASS